MTLQRIYSRITGDECKILSLMFSRNLRHAEHTRSYSICAAGAAGWEVRLEEDRKLRRLDHYRDWHRVERAKASFEREVQELTDRGWEVAN